MDIQRGYEPGGGWFRFPRRNLGRGRWVALALQLGGRSTRLRVVQGQLQVEITGPFSRGVRVWPRQDLSGLRAGPSGVSINRRPLLELQLRRVDGVKISLLRGRTAGELAWVGTLLRNALGLPEA